MRKKICLFCGEKELTPVGGTIAGRVLWECQSCCSVAIEINTRGEGEEGWFHWYKYADAYTPEHPRAQLSGTITIKTGMICSKCNRYVDFEGTATLPEPGYQDFFGVRVRCKRCGETTIPSVKLDLGVEHQEETEG